MGLCLYGHHFYSISINYILWKYKCLGTVRLTPLYSLSQILLNGCGNFGCSEKERILGGSGGSGSGGGGILPLPNESGHIKYKRVTILNCNLIGIQHL